MFLTGTTTLVYKIQLSGEKNTDLFSIALTVLVNSVQRRIPVLLSLSVLAFFKLVIYHNSCYAAGNFHYNFINEVH